MKISKKSKFSSFQYVFENLGFFKNSSFQDFQDFQVFKRFQNPICAASLFQTLWIPRWHHEVSTLVAVALMFPTGCLLLDEGNQQEAGIYAV